jgi:hypothetical protein
MEVFRQPAAPNAKAAGYSHATHRVLLAAAGCGPGPFLRLGVDTARGEAGRPALPRNRTRRALLRRGAGPRLLTGYSQREFTRLPRVFRKHLNCASFVPPRSWSLCRFCLRPLDRLFHPLSSSAFLRDNSCAQQLQRFSAPRLSLRDTVLNSRSPRESDPSGFGPHGEGVSVLCALVVCPAVGVGDVPYPRLLLRSRERRSR